jgi:predicted ester cyclase
MSNRKVIDLALECFANPAKRTHYFDLYAEDIVLHGYPGVNPGLESVRAYYEAFWVAFPDARVSAEDIVEQENTMALRFLLTGTHRGLFLNLAPTGRSISVSGITILQFLSGKCVERWSVVDSISLLAQLGVNVIPQ